MPCLTEKLALGGSLATLAASGVVAVVGAPTVVLSVVGAGAALGAMVSAIASIRDLKECYERHGKKPESMRMALAIARLEAEVARLQAGPRIA